MKRMFIPLAKADASQRLVYGSIDETPDRAREIMDYPSAKLAFQNWSEGLFKASGGKSYGNVRAQHNKNSAAGLLKSIDFDDEAKRIDFCAHIVDDQEWAKVEAGVYTGFSPGGSYAKRWADPDVAGHHRYTPSVGELSIVDVPCIPSANFTMVKADGSEEEIEFVLDKAYEPGNDATKARAEEMAKAAPGTTYKDHVVQARAELIAENAEAELEKLAPDVEGENEDRADAGGADEPVEKADVVDALEAALEKAEKAKKSGKYGDVEYADAKNKKYPVDTAAHIRAAWSYINMSKNQKGYTSDEVKAIKAKIVSAWKDKIDPDGPPEAAEKMLELGGLAKLAPALAVLEAAADEQLPLHKGMYQVQRLASLVDCVADLQCSCKWEAEAEGDDSTVPEEVANAVASLGTILIHMVTEEVQEIVDGYRISGMDVDFDPDAGDEVLEMALKIVDLAKAERTELEKAGKRNSKADAERVQAIHDKACELGADCADMSAEKVATLEADRERLAKSVESAIPRIEELTERLETMATERATDREDMAKMAQQIVELGGQPAPTKLQRAIEKHEDSALDKSDEGGPDPDSLEAINALPAGAERQRKLLKHAERVRASQYASL